MKEKQEFIKVYLEDVSIRKIALQVKNSRKTINKYIKQFEKSRQKDKIRKLLILEKIMKPLNYKKD